MNLNLSEYPQPYTSLRINCPVCGGNNTLSVSNLGTKIVYFCFRAACHTRGASQISPSIKALEHSFTPKKVRSEPFSTDEFLFIPNSANKETLTSTIKKYNSWPAYNDRRADIRYDPKRNRLVFIIYDGRKKTPQGAIGRTFCKTQCPTIHRKKAKWYRYGDSTIPFTCKRRKGGGNSVLIIVEDCFSACAASIVADSAALLGTYLNESYIPIFSRYSQLIIALDKDASEGALKMQRKLQFYTDTKVVYLTEDIKSMSPTQTKEIFNDYIS